MKDSVSAGEFGGASKVVEGNSVSSGSPVLIRRATQITLLFVGVVVLWMCVYSSATPFGFRAVSNYFNSASLKVSSLPRSLIFSYPPLIALVKSNSGF
ncbi:hypothetical protein L6164_006322 [Bauhinia variegata]|uniref:Uncharacterized protein n=1 Tax=Bauhinia variegata TaxID=167791 RepID=A0ACB9PTH1_BAUVA|nr:hypothetical protein L6164_006322 [Bauhinia variegata]